MAIYPMKSGPVAVASALFLPLAMAAPGFAQNAAAGGALFKQRCQVCHIVTPGKPALMAPNLAGVAGRRAGSTAFAYSAALKSSKLVWDRKTLDSFLLSPMTKVPGTRMAVSVSDAKQRADIVAYLSTLKP